MIGYDWPGQRGDKWLEHVEAMESMLRPFDAPLIDALALSEAARLAELGCGGGASASAVLEAAPEGSSVLGLDVHGGLVEVARRRCQGQRAEFRVADVETLGGLENRFDRIYSRFGVMFFQSAERAFARMRGWLAPGGAVVFMVWGPPPENPWITVVRDAVARAVDLPAGDPDAPGPFRYAADGRLGVLLRSAGFVDVRQHPVRCTVELGGVGAAEASRFALSGFSTFAERLAKAGPEAQAVARTRLTECLGAYERADGRVELPAAAWVVRGVKAD